ncbi:diguanylate cyclase [Microbacterium flavescens]|uniref:diguanylate cyclase n=1 Tax=Microbacterium flavescens TaxID=69366 RepID=UPI001BDEA5F2|nr:diguanylate cyclase [Microbacterium flavescens]BFF08939.1 hypothetical protein GCM10025699_02420 [Microbacterium flavescens]
MNDQTPLPVGIVHLDHNGEIVKANPWFSEWAGVPAEALAGRRVDEFLVHANEDLLTLDDARGPWVMVHAQDPDRAVMATRHRRPDEDLLVMAEASDRFRALRDLRRRYSLADRTRTRLELVMDSSIAFSTATNEDRLAQILADTTARAYRAEESTVYLHQPDGTSVIAAGYDGLEGRFDAEALIAMVSAPRRIIKVVDEDEAERLVPGLGAAMRAASVRAFIAAPLHHEEIDFGAFVSWFHHDRLFDDEASTLAEALAGQAAQSLATLRLQARLAHAATHDDVTGLPNRRLLEAEMEEVMRSVHCAALFIDLDDFKSINDRLGHHVGDRMLREAGQRLASAVRSADLVARYGGDEFVVLCDVTDTGGATEIAERILGVLRGEHAGAPTRPALRASIGIAVARSAEELPSELLRRADVAMYHAKSAGGDRFVIAD